MPPRMPRYPMQTSPVPSQRRTGGIPYANNAQPDLQGDDLLRDVSRIGYPDLRRYVVPVWDSRKINGQDFVKDNSLASPHVEGEPETFHFVKLPYDYEWTVPAGRIWILKAIDFRFYPTFRTDIDPDTGDITMLDPVTPMPMTDQFGNSFDYYNVVTLSVNDAVVPNYGELYLDWSIGVYHIPCFVICPENSVIRLRIDPNQAFNNLEDVNFQNQVLIYGNDDIYDGTDPALEAGTDDVLPVNVNS